MRESLQTAHRFHIKPLYNLKFGKQAACVIISGVIFILGIAYVLETEAKTKTQPMVFLVDHNLKPLKFTLYGPPKPSPAIIPKKVSPKPNPKPAPKSKPADSGRNYGQGEIQSLIIQYSKQYGIQADTALCIANKESGFNSNARNPHSTAKGIFQYLDNTWRATDEGKMGLSVFNAEANVKAAIKYMSSRHNAIPWTVAKNCPPVTPINL